MISLIRKYFFIKYLHIFFLLYSVDAVFVEKQKKILSFFQDVSQLNTDDEYYKIGKDYDIEMNMDNYTVSTNN